MPHTARSPPGTGVPARTHPSRHPAEHRVPPLGVPEGVGMGPGGVYSCGGRRLLHALADPLPADVEERPVTVPAVEGDQVRQWLHQVGGHRHLAPPLGLVARDVRPQAEDGRVLGEPEVRGPEGQALGHPEPGAEHDAHGHADLVAGCGRHQRQGLVGGEVVGQFLGFSCHGKGRFGGFPQLTLQNPVARGKLVRRGSRVEMGRLVAENPDFRKWIMSS